MSFQRIKLTIQYKGSSFAGWQRQPRLRTVQSVLEESLAKVISYPVHITASGRTDAGVHALAQVCHFDLPLEVLKKNESLQERLQKIQLGLNSNLPDSISVIQIEKASQKFHSQLASKKKTYSYLILNSRARSPFLSDYSWRVTPDLSIKAMREAAKHLVGFHNFKAFAASDGNAKTFEREILKISIRSFKKFEFFENSFDFQPGLGSKDRLIQIKVEGSGFLKHMVRTIVGTLVEVGRGYRVAADLEKILKSQDRKKAGKTAPAQGLFLFSVNY